MKKLIIISLLLFSVRAFACPKIAGEYLCEENGQSEYWNFTQREENGVIVFNDETGDYFTDGKSRPIHWGILEGNYVAECEADVLKIHLAGEIFLDEGKWADMKSTDSYRITGENELTIDYVYARDRVDGVHEEFNGTLRCTRQ